MVTRMYRGCGTGMLLWGIVLGVSMCPRAAAASEPVAGDCNGSGDADAVDVQLVVNGVLGISVAFPTDVNRSGRTDAVDVQLVVNVVLGIVVDHDADGLCDGAESNIGTDPNRFDTDGDGVGDGAELLAGTNPTVPDASEPGRWVEATRAAPWAGRYGHTSVAHNGKLWVIGGRAPDFMDDVWSSADGIDWTAVREPGSWPFMPRYGHATVSFDGKLWVIGGWTGAWGGMAMRDVFSSPDGQTWTEVTSDAPWAGRMGHSVVVHDGKMWLFGGGYRDLWFSANGEHWERAMEQGPWSYATPVSGVLGDSLWVLGGENAQNDVWQSLDGMDWQQVLLHAPWPVREDYTVDVHHNSLVVLGGKSDEYLNDVWYSADGERWWQEQTFPRWASRRGHATVAFVGRLWVVGGYSFDTTVFVEKYYNDVWYFEGDWECEAGEPNAAPRVRLVADPPTTSVSGQIMFRAVADDRNCDCLTYTWDFGDGTSQIGTASILHTFEEEGVYSATVTVSDGAFQAADSIEVTVESVSYQEALLDAEGGSVSNGDCTLTVPAALLDRPVSFRVSEWPDMTPQANDHFPPSRFQALGAAFRIDTPLRSPTPMALDVEHGELPAGTTPDLLALLVRVLTKSDPPDATRGPLSVDYVLLPPRPGPKQGMVRFDLYDAMTVQLVLLDKPLEVLDFRATKQAAPSFEVVFLDDPTALDKATYTSVVNEALTAAYNNYVTGKGFPEPDGALTVAVKAIRNAHGGVPPENPLIVLLSPALDADGLRKTAAHEFFHVIQGMCTNVVSAKLHIAEDAWFDEGTASWAADEVYDSLSETYYAPKPERFAMPLNNPGMDEFAYYTVVFWKWIEANTPGITLAALAQQRDRTHVVLPSGALLQHPVDVTRLSSFTAVAPDVDFLDYAASALYWKDFDTNETKEGDLWTEDKLGATPLELTSISGPFANWKHHLKQGVGDAEENPKNIDFTVYESLTADTHIVATKEDLPSEEKLHGRLHVRWPKMATGKSLDAIVIVYQYTRILGTEVVRDLSQEHEDTIVPFYSDEYYRAAIIVVDPRWRERPPDVELKGQIKVWVADCGPWPGEVTEVTNTDELVAALKAVAPGNTIHMAPGAYSPPVQDWNLPGWYTYKESLLINGVTLVGSGIEETTIFLRPSDKAEILTYGDASLRDMKIDIIDSWALFSAGGHLKICNVETTGGVYIIPFDPGNHGLTLINCTIGGYWGRGYGVYLEPDSSVPHNSISATIEDTVIYGWEYGVHWWTWTDSGTVTMTADCTHIFDNVEGNVVQWVQDGNINIEYCTDELRKRPLPKMLPQPGRDGPEACGCGVSPAVARE